MMSRVVSLICFTIGFGILFSGIEVGLEWRKVSELFESSSMNQADGGKTPEPHDTQFAREKAIIFAYENRPSKMLETPLHKAALTAKTACITNSDCFSHIKYLIDQEADNQAIYATDDDGATFLHYLFRPHTYVNRKQFSDLVRFLAAKGVANLFNVEDKWKESPILLAMMYVLEISEETLDLLHKNQINFNTANVFGISTLTYAVLSLKKREIIAKLLKFGANYNTSDGVGVGNGLLHNAAFVGNIDAVRLIVEERLLDVNGRSTYGNTPLHLALGRFDNLDGSDGRSWDNVHDVVNCLVEGGANLRARNKKGETPFDIAYKNKNLPGRQKILRLLKL